MVVPVLLRLRLVGSHGFDLIRNSRLGVLGVVSLGLYLSLALGAEANNSVRSLGLFLAYLAVLFSLYGIGAWRIGRRRRRGTLGVILGFAAAFRLAMCLAGLPDDQPLRSLRVDVASAEVAYDTFLLYDNDVWRYLWEGHVIAAGVSPYRWTPLELAEGDESPEPAVREASQRVLDGELWWDVFDNISFQGLTTVYPPLAQLLFRVSHALAPGSVFVFKLLLSGIDLATCWLLVLLLRALGRRQETVFLYAWNPLAIKEISGSGHADGLMILLLVATVLLLVRGRPACAQVGLGLATLAKLGGVVLAPLVIRRSPVRLWWVLPLIVGLGLSLFLSATDSMRSGLSTYARDWVFNSGPWALVRAGFDSVGLARPGLAAHLVTKVALVALMLWAFVRAREAQREGLVRWAFYLTAAVVILNPAVMPWYLLWALPFAVACGSRAWIVLTGLSLLSYLYYIDQTEQAWWLWIEYGVFAVVAVWEATRGRVISSSR